MAFEPTRDDSGRFAKDLSNQARLVKEIADTQAKIAALKKNYVDGDKEQLKLIKEQQAYLNKLGKINKQNTAEIKQQAENYEEIDDTMVSIGNRLKHNSKLAEITRDKFEATKSISKQISTELAKGGATNKKTGQQVLDALEAYKQSQISIAQINASKAEGAISEEKRLEQIKEATEDFKVQLSLIDRSKITSKELLDILDGMGNEAESFSHGIQQAQIHAEHLDHVAEELSSELGGIGPIIGKINALTKTNIKDTLAWKAAVFALGAALGKAAYDYFGAPIQAGLQADKERHEAEIDGIADVAKIRKDAESIPAQINQEKIEHELEANEQIRKAQIDAQYASERAANAFSAAMQSAAAEFRAASKTALFGKGLGSVGYGAAQLQLAGIGADKIAGAMSSAAAATGKMPTGKAAADMAIMAERTGTSVDDIAQITEHFQRIDGMSAQMSMNMAEGMRSMADQAGISLGNLMKEVAESSKEALGYQIKSGPALAKAVTYAQSMGVSFGDVAKAGKSMVMNYKDSIKAEMQLSSLLGEQVDLSEVRAKFAEGDTTGAMQALQAQGLDPAQMDMFQQEALSQALGGMDLQSLSKLATGKGKEAGPLKAGNAGAGNQQFLGATQAAQASLQSEQASISAQQAVLDAELSKTIGEAYLNDPKYAEYKKAQADAAVQAAELATKMKMAWLATDEYKKSISDKKQLEFIDKIKEGFFAVIASLGGGFLATMGSKMFSKGGGGGISPSIPGGGVPPTPGGGAPPTPGAGPSPGGGGGGGFGGALKGIAEGLKAFASPQVLVGLAAITIALKVLEPVIASLVPVMIKIAEVIGNVLVKALEVAGPIITAIFEGIGFVIKSIGEAISGVITAVADSLIKIGSINAINLMGVALALPVLAGGLLALGAAELINGIMGFIGSIFGGGESIWDKLIELSTYGPGLMAAATAVSVLAPAFAMLSDVDDGDNLDDLMDNLMSAMGKLDEKTQNLMKSMGPSMQQLGNGAYALGVVRSNPNLELLGSQIQTLLNTDTQSAITSGTPLIDKLGTTLNSFGTSTRGLAEALFAVNPQLMILLNTMSTFSQISAGIDITTMALQNMASALANVSKINTSNLVKVPWDKMSGFSKSGGNFVLATSANNNFNVTQDTAKNIKDMTANSKIMMNLTKNIEALTKALFEKQATAPIVSIDGKKLNSATNRYAEYHKAQT